MGEELSTDVASSAPDVSATGDALAPATTPGGELQSTTGLDTPPAYEAIINAIPADDSDLAASASAPMYKDVIRQRSELRVLSSAIKDLQPLSTLRDLGEPDYITARMQLFDRLYSPVIDEATGRPAFDQVTQTTPYTTRPFLEALESENPGVVQQLFADASALEIETPTGGRETIGKQYLRFLGLAPLGGQSWTDRLNQFRNIDAILSSAAGDVTLEELAAIPTDYHEAFRALPPSVRSNWATLKETDQATLLRNEKERIDRRAADAADKAERERRDAYEVAQYHGLIRQEQVKYFDTVRREQFTVLSNSLSNVKFSDDPTRDAVLHGALYTSLVNLLDPDFRFVGESSILKALNVTLPQAFLQQIDIFNAKAAEYVALLMQGERDRADIVLKDVDSAVNRVMAKLAVIAIDIAKAMGGEMQARTDATGKAVAAATQTRPGVGNASTSADYSQGVLPAGIRPGSDEANAYWANNLRERMRAAQ